MKLVLGNEVIGSYRRLSYKAWYALAEFVDNSTQAYFNNRAVLDPVLASEGRRLEVYITYDGGASPLIRIADNSMGMSLSELEDAMHIGKPPANTSGRSEYGLGLKTAASWFGNEWTVTTKKLGEAEEHSVTVDIEKIVAGDDELRVVSIPKSLDSHYTIVEIGDLNRKLNGWSIRNTIDYLSSMFRLDLRDGFLDLRFNTTQLASPFTPDDSSFLQRVDGSPVKVSVDTEIGGRRVTGYIGVMRPGVASRRLAGFNVVRRGRCVQGWLDAWKPEEIFGAGGRNDLVNQRLTGELYLNDFTASHTKDAILWRGDEEEELIAHLKALCEEFELIHIANSHRGEDATAYTSSEREAGISEFNEIMTDPEMVDAITIKDVPPPELGPIKEEEMIKGSDEEEPRVRIAISEGVTIDIIFFEAHPNDPYYAYSVRESGSLVVRINEAHPGFVELPSKEAIVAYSKHCAFDAIAEWKCRGKGDAISPESVKLIKDDLFRVSAAIQSRKV